MIASVVVAIKFYDDKFFDNEYYSKVGGVPCVEMNLLEIEMLQMLDYDLVVAAEEYEKYMEHIARLYAPLHSAGPASSGKHVPDKENPALPSSKAVTSPPPVETKLTRERSEIGEKKEAMCDQVPQQQ